MKKYFEYEFNDEIKKRLSNYYEDTNLDQHKANHLNKSKLKINRIKKLVSFSEKDSVMDIGCSRGHLLELLSPQIKNGVGMDISKNVILLNKKSNRYKNIRYLVFDGKDIKVKQKFNKVLMLDVLEHALNPNILIKNVKNRMSNDSQLILGVPFTGWVSELIFGKYHQGHLRYYDPTYLTKYLEKNGFRVKKIKVYNSVPFSSFFIKHRLVYSVLDFLIGLIPPCIYPYFGEIIVIVKNEK
jgi:SAM-dependent methyltransferase